MVGLGSPLILVLLALFGFVGGIGITAVGPGGVLPTIGMFLFTGLSPAGVAGTAIITHIATGMLATGAYTKSGHLREPRTRRIATILAITALVGTPLGVLINTRVDGRIFGLLLAIVIAMTGILVWVRELRSPEEDGAADLSPTTTATVGIAVAVVSGIFGLGGPMLSVPLLVLAGLPVLPALAAAQAQSVIIACIGTAGYLLHGSIDWVLALVVGIPELAGVLLGWKIARKLPAGQLKYALAVTLLLLAPYLAFQS